MSTSTTVSQIRAAGVRVGSTGTVLTKIEKGEITVDLASVNADTEADATATVTGAAAGDIVILNPKTAALTAGLLVCQAHVSAADTVKFRISNRSGGAIDEASATWYYVLIKS